MSGDDFEDWKPSDEFKRWDLERSFFERVGDHIGQFSVAILVILFVILLALQAVES